MACESLVLCDEQLRTRYGYRGEESDAMASLDGSES